MTGTELTYLIPEFDRMYNWGKIKDDPEKTYAYNRALAEARNRACQP